MTTEHTAGEVSRTAEGGRWLLFPEYGLVDAILGFGLFYLLVSIATDPLARGLSSVLAVEPGLVRTGFVIALWVMLGLIVLGQLSRQLQTNPHRFADARERRAFLDRYSPGPGHFLKAVVAGLLGTAIIWSIWEAFLVSFGRFVTVIVDPVHLASMSLASVLWIVSFFIGFALFSYGIDRLVVGLVRTLIAGLLDGPDIDEPPA